MITVLLLAPALDVTYLVGSVELGGIHRPESVLKLAGGKGLNVARALRRIGESEVRVITPLGGHTGDLVAELAGAEGLPIVAVAAHGETRTCVTVIDESDGAHTEFYEGSPALSDAALREIASEATGPGWTVLSGSVPADTDVDLVTTVLRDRARAGSSLAVDTHGPVLDAIVSELRPHLVKVNRVEAVQVLESLGVDVSADAAAIDLARNIHARTGGTAIVTDGVHGSSAVNTEGAWRVLPHPNIGRYSVGSGDTFFAGLLFALTQGAPLPEALARASATAVANSAVPGAGRFELADVERALADVTVVAEAGVDIARLFELTDTVTIATRAPGGELRPTFVWSVAVDGRPYVRSAFGAESVWFRRVVAQRSLIVDVDAAPSDTEARPLAGVARGVTLAAELIPDDEANAVELDAVSAAFARKYGHDATNLAPLLSAEARACTVRLSEL